MSEREPVEIVLSVDGAIDTHITSASNIRQFLEEIDVPVGPSDIISPPLFTPLVEDTDVSIIRVAENIEVIGQTVPFE